MPKNKVSYGTFYSKPVEFFIPLHFFQKYFNNRSYFAMKDLSQTFRKIPLNT